MLWQLLRGYDTYGKPEVRRQGIGALDEVKCGGNLKIKVIHSLGSNLQWSFVLRYLPVLTSEAEVRKILLEEEMKPVTIVQTSPRYLPHLRKLSQWKIISHAAKQELLFCSTYFAIAKDAALDRAIFNGKRVSSLFLCPPPVNIAEITTINKMFSELVQPPGIAGQAPASRKVYGFTADFRHFFHQIPVNGFLRRIFGLSCGEEQFCWNTLPMGWSWSPFLAQSVGWLLLCGRHSNEAPLFNEDFTGDNGLPTFLHLKDCPGFAVLYYDNILVVGSDARIIQAIKTRLVRNMAVCGSLTSERLRSRLTRFYERYDPPKLAQLQAIVDGYLGNEEKLFAQLTKKYGPEPTVTAATPLADTIKELTSFGPNDHVRYLGCEYRFVRKRDRNGNLMWSLEWRVLDKSVPHGENWLTAATARGVARRIGKSLYRWLLEGRYLIDNPRAVQTLGLLKRVSRDGPRNWDADFHCSNEELQLLEDCRLELVQNSWISRSRETPRVFVISDASTSVGYGYCIVNAVTRELIAVVSSVWHTGMENMHIFYLEAFSALIGLQHARRIFAEDRCFGLITDNTAVAGALRRGYSSSDIMIRWMATYGFSSYETEVHTVVSADNHSDALSRLQPTVLNLPGILEQIAQLRQGRRGSCQIQIPIAFTGEVRHPEPLDDVWDDLYAEV